jgi:hypothetical protein
LMNVVAAIDNNSFAASAFFTSFKFFIVSFF